MTDLRRSRARGTITVLVALAELAHLAWEHLHGGVASHHLLNRADLPAISNAWGALFLPALAWVLSGPVIRRTRCGTMSPRNSNAAEVSANAGSARLKIAQAR